ncbi:MAG: hypothetical protein WC449_01835 [Candidatus Paceibacterota bacterium]
MRTIWDLIPPYDRDEYAAALVSDVNRNVAIYSEEAKKTDDKMKLVELILLKLGHFNEKYPFFLLNHHARKLLEGAEVETTNEKSAWKMLKKFTLPGGRVVLEKVQDSERNIKIASRTFLKLVDENGQDIPETVWTDVQKLNTLHLAIGS